MKKPWCPVIAAIVFLVSAAVSARAQAPATVPGRCASSPPPTDPLKSARWNGWGAGLTNTRFQPADQAGLTAAQLPNLKLKWAFGFENSAYAYAQPIVAGGRLFVGSQSGSVYSLDPKTGCMYWTFRAQNAVRAAMTVGLRKTARGDGYTVYAGDLGGHAYAIDATTGDLLWARKVDEHAGARITGAPTLYQGRLYVPVASAEEALARNPTYHCCTFRGSLVALDAQDGNVVWKTYTLDQEAKPLAQGPTGGQRLGPSGAGIWSSPTIDAKRRLVYVATGNMYTEPSQKTSDALLAMDLETGKVKWANQMTTKDVFVVGCESPSPNCPLPSELGPDFDFGNAPMLATVNGRDMIVVGQKSGIGWGLDPDKSGAVMWQYRAGKGSALGGMEWGSAADGERAYFPNSDVLGQQPGGLHAVRLDTGDRVWFAPPPPLKCGTGPGCTAAQSAAITVIPGVVFSGSFDGAMRGYSTRDGSIIWEFDTNREFDTVNGVKAKGGSIGGAAGPVVVNGMVYVSSGYGGLAGRAGNVLLAFGVD